jgi:hypothetical protein
MLLILTQSLSVGTYNKKRNLYLICCTSKNIMLRISFTWIFSVVYVFFINLWDLLKRLSIPIFLLKLFYYSCIFLEFHLTKYCLLRYKLHALFLFQWILWILEISTCVKRIGVKIIIIIYIAFPTDLYLLCPFFRLRAN